MFDIIEGRILFSSQLVTFREILFFFLKKKNKTKITLKDYGLYQSSGR